MTPEESIRENAEAAVQFAKRLGVTLTFDRKGVEWLDGFLLRSSRQFSKEKEEAIVNVMGSFLGECLVKNHGGRWRQFSDDGEWTVELSGAMTVAASVFSKVAKRLQGGEGDSVVGFFDVALEVAAKGLPGESNSKPSPKP